MIINPRQRLRMAAVGEQEAAYGVHLPQLLRPAPLPPLPLPFAAPPPVRLDQPRPPQTAIHRRLGHPEAWTGLADLDRHPPRTPRRMPPPGLQYCRLHHRRHLMRTLPRPVRPIRQTLKIEPRGVVGFRGILDA